MSLTTKLVSAATSLMLAVTLVACGGSKPAPAPDATATSDTTTTETTSTDSTTETTTESTEKVDLAKEGYIKGTISGDTYTNETFGLSYTLPADYKFATDEEVAQLNNTTVEALKDDADYIKTIEEGSAFIEMSAKSTKNSDNVNLTIERFDPALAEEYTAQQITDQVYKNILGDNSALETIGCTDITSKMTTVTIDGKERPAEEVHAKLGDIDLTQYYVVFVAKNYICNICATTSDANNIPTMLNGISVAS